MSNQRPRGLAGLALCLLPLVANPAPLGQEDAARARGPRPSPEPQQRSVQLAGAQLLALTGGAFDDLDFADRVLGVRLGSGGEGDPDGALRPIDGRGVLRLGAGGELRAAFTDNVLVTTGDARPDLALFGRLDGVELALRAADGASAELLRRVLGRADREGFFALGRFSGEPIALDVDALLGTRRGTRARISAVRVRSAAAPAGGPLGDAAWLGGILALGSEPLPEDVVSRELSIQILSSMDDFVPADVVSRELSVQILSSEDAFEPLDVVSRELSVQVLSAEDDFVPLDVVSRELSVQILSSEDDFLPADVVSRELSVQVFDFTSENGPLDAVSREMSIFVPGGADLRVMAANAPATAGTDEPVALSWFERNAGNDAAGGDWVTRLSWSSDGTPGGIVASVDWPVTGPMTQGENRSFATQIPAPHLPGTYWLLFEADADDQVAEEYLEDSELNNLLVLDHTIEVSQVPRPALVVQALTPPAQASGGETIELVWWTVNTGSAVATGTWTESVSLVDDERGLNPMLLTLDPVTATLAPGESLLRVVQVPLPARIPAEPWLQVCTNAGEELILLPDVETCAVEQICPTCQTPDLRPTLVAAAPTVEAGALLSIDWSVLNEGDGAAGPPWTDRVELVREADGVVVAQAAHVHAAEIAAMAEVGFTLALAVPTEALGEHRVRVVVDAANQLYEPSGELDNGLAALETTLVVQPARPDLVLTAQLSASQVVAGEPVEVTWSGTNAGKDVAVAPWIDRVVVTTQASPPPGSLGLDETQLLSLDPGQDYPAAVVRTLVLPPTPDTYRVFVIADVLDDVDEGDGELGNVVLAGEVEVVAPPRPNLAFVAASLIPPGAAPVGAMVPVSWQIINDGEIGLDAGDGGPENVLWNERIYASADPFVGGDVLLATHVYGDALPVGGVAQRTRMVPVPALTNGYYIVVQLDPTDAVDETSEGDNLTIASELSPVILPNLFASAVQHPTSGLAEELVTVTWTVTNGSIDATAQSPWLDTVYLREVGSPVLQPLGSAARSLPLAPGAHYDASLDVALPPYALGAYEVLVVADSQGAVAEPDDADNSALGGLVTIGQPDRPNLVVSSVTLPADDLVGRPFTAAWRIENTGDAPAEPPFTDRVYAVDADTGAELVVGFATIAQAIEPGGFLDLTAPATMPTAPGSYRLAVVTDRTNAVNEGPEGGEDDNRGETTASFAAETFFVVAETSVTGEPTPPFVPITGTATTTMKGRAAADVPVEVAVDVQGSRRVLSAVTDGTGTFALDFHPLPAEAGAYTLRAGPSGQIAETPTDGFELYALRAQPAARTLVVYPGFRAATTSFVLRNLGDTLLSGLSVDPLSPPAGITVDVTLEASNLEPLGEVLVNVAASADVGLPMQLVPLTLSFACAQGAESSASLTLDVRPPAATLVTSPAALVQPVQVPAPGGQPIQTLVELTLTNVGAGVSDPIVVIPPAVDWIDVATQMPLEPLSQGESSVVTLILQPAEGELPPGADASGSIQVLGGASALQVLFTFTGFLDGEASIRVRATDEGTYWDGTNMPRPPDDPEDPDDDRPYVGGATVTVREYFTQELVGEPMTAGADGLALFESLLPGYYVVRTEASGHATNQVTRFIGPDEHLDLEAFLPIQGVTYTWNVEPTEIEDQYLITVDLEFETFVPAPVVTVEPAYVDLDQLAIESGGAPFQIDYTVTNHGLVQANDLHFSTSDASGYRLTPLATDLGDLSPDSGVVVPVVVTPLAGAGGFGCTSAVIRVDWELLCDLFPVPYSATVIGHTARKCPPPPPPSGPGPAPTGGSGEGVPGGGEVIVDGTPIVGELSCACVQPVVECLIGDCLDIAPNCDRDFACTTLLECFDSVVGIADCVQTVVGCGKQIRGLIKGQIDRECICVLLRDCVLADQPWSEFIPCNDDEAAALLGTAIDAVLDAILSEGGYARGTSEGWSGFLGTSPDPIEQFAITQFERILVFEAMQWYPYGHPVWLQVPTNEAAVMDQWHAEFVVRASSESEQGGVLSAGEQAELLTIARPSNLADADLERFFARWNRTEDYWGAGIYTLQDLPPGFEADFIDRQVMSALFQATWDATDGAIDGGFAGILDAWSFAQGLLEQTLFGPQEGVCATVSLAIDQTAVVTRGAFRASLTLDNGSGSPLDAVELQIELSDLDGGQAWHLFAVQLESSEGIGSWDGMETLLPGDVASGAWLVIPSNEAAPTEPVEYRLAGTLSYVQDGVFQVFPLTPFVLEVWPNAELKFRYFIERDVYGDDPFTAGLEPSVPFDLGLLVTNEGAGATSSVRVTSAQPVIVENEQQLVIDFQIIGSQVGTMPAGPSLTADLGGLGAGGSNSARWQMLSTLDGRFVSFDASIENLNGLDDPEFWVVNPLVDVFPMLRSVRTDEPLDDGVFDFVSLGIDPMYPEEVYVPELVWTSTGETLPVAKVLDARATVVPGDPPMATLTVAINPFEWTYIRLDDPFGGQYALTGVVRGDGKSLLVGPNAWQTERVLTQGPSTPEPRVHLFDKGGDGTYTLVFEEDTVPPRVLSWAARAPHGDLGTGTELIYGNEPWTDPHPGGPLVLRVAFSEPIASETFTPANVQLFRSTGGATGVPVAFMTQVTNGGTTGDIVLLEPVPNRSRLCVQLTGVLDRGGNALCPENASLDGATLIGEVDGDALVTPLDLALIESLVGTDPIDLGQSAQLRADLDRDGRIDATDRAILRSQLASAGSSLPPPCEAHAPGAAPCDRAP